MPIIIPIGVAAWKIATAIGGTLLVGGGLAYGGKKYINHRTEKRLQVAYAQHGKAGLKAAMITEGVANTDGQADFLASDWIRQRTSQPAQPETKTESSVHVSR